MKVIGVSTYIVGAGFRNLLFVEVHTDAGLSGVGEGTNLWQVRATEAALQDLAERYVVGEPASDIERLIHRVHRDEFMRADGIILSGLAALEMALWDIRGKALGVPVYELLGGTVHSTMPAYANGWYEGVPTPEKFAELAIDVVALGYRGIKFDPFGAAGREMLPEELQIGLETVAAVRDAVGPGREILIECHGRFSPGQAIELARLLAPYRPYWLEEPTDPEALGALRKISRAMTARLATGERHWGRFQTAELLRHGVVDILQSDVVQCGGILETKKIAAMAEAVFVGIAPHNPYGPVAEMAVLHTIAGCANLTMVESFSQFDVPWRRSLVRGGAEINAGQYSLPTEPGLGVALNHSALEAHPYDPGARIGMWDKNWADQFSAL